MTKALNYYELLERRNDARMRRESKEIEKMERREVEAEKMIGELSSGKFYVFPVGGKYREGSRNELTRFLIRNNYA